MTDLERVRTIARGYHAEHLLEQDLLNELAKVIYGTYAKRDLRVMADKEGVVAAEFAIVADLLDQATTAPARGNVIRCADGGAYVYEDDGESIPDPKCGRCGVESNHHDEDGCHAWSDWQGGAA